MPCYSFPQYQPRHSQNAQGPCGRCPVPWHRAQVIFTFGWSAILVFF